MVDERIIAVDSRSALMPAVYRLRHEVFVVEQSVPPELERDDLDDGATHLVALRDGEVIGTLRLLVSGQTTKVGRMAVLTSMRRNGVGTRLMGHAAEVAQALGAREIVLHAQLTARDFYLRLGYCEEGSLFEEAGIPHIAMRKALAAGE
jgi:predicted GNAT family N-acyltransferase